MNTQRKEQLVSGIRALMENEAFVASVAAAQDSEAIAEALGRYGIRADREEIGELAMDGLASVYTELPSDDELSLDDLETVAGGGKWRGRVRMGLALLGGAAVGLACGVAVAATGGAATPVAVAVGGGCAAAATAWVVDGYAKKGW